MVCLLGFIDVMPNNAAVAEANTEAAAAPHYSNLQEMALKVQTSSEKKAGYVTKKGRPSKKAEQGQKVPTIKPLPCEHNEFSSLKRLSHSPRFVKICEQRFLCSAEEEARSNSLHDVVQRKTSRGG